MHRVAPQLIDVGGLAHHDAGLRSAQQFVAAERHHVDAAGDHLVDRRFVVQAVGLQIDQRTAAQVLHDRQVVLAAQRHQFLPRHLGGKADDAVIAGVHPQQQRSVGRDGRGVVAPVRLVGAADLTQDSAAAAHDVGNAERAADFDELAARHDHLPALGQRL